MTYHTFTSSLKKIAYIGAFLFIFLTTQTHAAVIPPGNFSTCGEFAAPGTYTLTADITDNSICQVTSSGVEIDTNGFEFTVTMEVSNGAEWSGDTSGWDGIRIWKFYDTSSNIFALGFLDTAEFYGGSFNAAIVPGTAYFYENSYNMQSIYGYAYFYDSSYNDGYINYAEFYGDSYNSGTIVSSGALFEDYSVNRGIINGDVTFNDYSYNDSDIYGNVTFNDFSKHGTTPGGSLFITGDATFNDYSYNNAWIQGNATFTASTFDSSDGIYAADPTGISGGGQVDGIIIFTSLTPVTFYVRNTDVWNADISSWIFDGGRPSFEFYDTSANNSFLYAINTVTFYDTSYNANGIDDHYGVTFNGNSDNGGLLTSGDVTFNDNSNNSGQVDNSGSTTYFNGFSRNTGTVSGSYVTFGQDLAGAPYNDGTIENAQSVEFYGVSYNDGTIENAQSVEFYGVSYNAGSIGEVFFPVKFYGDSYNDLNGDVDSAEFYGNSYNMGPLKGGYFYNNSVNGGIIINDNTWDTVFNDDSYNNSNIYGNTYFTGQSYNRGSIFDANYVHFWDNSYNEIEGNITSSTVVFGDDYNGNPYNLGTINGDAIFYNNSCNDGIINGVTTFNDTSYTTYSSTITGDVIFNGSSYHYGTINGNATFNENSFAEGVSNGTSQDSYITGDVTFNGASGTHAIIEGNVTFNDTTVAYGGQITGNVTFNSNASLGSTIIIGDVILNGDSQIYGTTDINGNVTLNNNAFVNGAQITATTVTFNNSSYNDGGSITGNVIFNDDSYNAFGIISGNVIFNNSSYNDVSGSIEGNVTFNNSSYNDGQITGNASVYYPVSRPLGGTVSGDITYFNYPTTLYFNDKDTGDGDWNNVDNWWLDEAATDPALTIPFGSEDVYIQTSITTGTSNGAQNSITFEDAVTNNINLTATNFIFKGTSSNSATLTGNAVFENDASTNTGTITGTITRLYNTPTTTTRNFLTDSGRNDWTIIADGVAVNIINATYNIATNTLQTLNGGSFIQLSLAEPTTPRRSGSVSGGTSFTTPPPVIQTEVSEDIAQLQQQLRSLLLQLITLLQAQLEMLRGR